MENTEVKEAGITLQDIVLAVNIIDACSKRGAFEGNEMATVGALREKLAAFVRANAPAEETNTETEMEAEVE